MCVDMPKVRFFGQKVTQTDLDLAKAFEKSCSRYREDVLRQLDQLQSFMDANKDISEELYKRDYVWSVFAAQWRNSGRRMSTASAIVDNFITFRVNPWNIDDARTRVREYGMLNGLKRYARKVLLAERSFVRVIHESPLPYVAEARPKDGREREYQCMWCLICVTGNRPHDVMLAEISAINTTGVIVHWTTRKVTSGVNETYEFAWTQTPPEWVLQRWSELSAKPWLFKSASNMAASVNMWLKGKGSTLTSSSPRERLDRHLRELVEKRGMTQQRYEILLDHKYTTAVGHYNSAKTVKK